MICVCLKGGLGNQMFQYAAGRRLACLHKVPLKLDLSWFGEDLPKVTPRSYALGPFSIHAEQATDKEIALLYEPLTGRIRDFLNSLNPFYRKTHIRARNFHFDPAILRLPDNVCIDGYWQSEKYFSNIAPVIRSDFTVRSEPEGRNREVAAAINGSNAISIHFRRGDYVTDAKNVSRYGVCSIDYYRRAVELVSVRVARPHFFVFSDDPAWAREHFTAPHAMTVVDHNGSDKAHEDLRLMSLCRHHIIANSSFSWWGAWLNPRSDKLVIAPSLWFNETSFDTIDLLPASWLRLSV
jgi:hypothetical protein